MLHNVAIYIYIYMHYTHTNNVSGSKHQRFKDPLYNFFRKLEANILCKLDFMANNLNYNKKLKYTKQLVILLLRLEYYVSHRSISTIRLDNLSSRAALTMFAVCDLTLSCYRMTWSCLQGFFLALPSLLDATCRSAV